MTDAALTFSPADRLEIGSVVSRTLTITLNNLPRFLLLGVICVYIPTLLADVVKYNIGHYAVSWSYIFFRIAKGWVDTSSIIKLFCVIVFSAIGIVCLQATVVSVAVAQIGGRTTPSVVTARRNILVLLGIYLVYYIICAIGLILLIFPGIILSIALSVAVPVRVAEGRGVVGSIRRSLDLTRGLRWKILLFAILYVVGALLIGVIGGIIRVALHLPNEIWEIGALPALTAIFALLRTVGIAVLYTGLRAAKEGRAIAAEVAEAFA